MFCKRLESWETVIQEIELVSKVSRCKRGGQVSSHVFWIKNYLFTLNGSDLRHDFDAWQKSLWHHGAGPCNRPICSNQYYMEPSFRANVNFRRVTV